MADEIKEYPIPCAFCEEGTLEASSTIYLDVDKMRVDDEGRMYLIAVSPSGVNDVVNGVTMNIESEFTISCSACGKEPDWDMDDEFRAQVAPQPIGSAPREVGKRGGMDEAIAGAMLRKHIQSEIEKIKPGEEQEMGDEGKIVGYEGEEDGWYIWDDGDRYNYYSIDDVINELL